MASMKEVKMIDPSMVYRPDQIEKETGWTFRIYDSNSKDPKMKTVYNTYRNMHKNQCMEYVMNRQERWLKFDTLQGSIMEMLEKLNNLVDESDPDIDLPNIVHAFQTAERIRKEHPDLDWFHLVGLIHDLGKIMAFYDEPQWSTVGDTFPLGCAFAPSIVFSDSSFEGNPDVGNEKFNTKYGKYKPNCGLDNVTMCWGHDEYLYRVLKENKCTLPEEGLYVIRFHSFYPYHTGNDYGHLADNHDEEMLPWLKEFNKFDLYTKQEDVPDIEKLKPYYNQLIKKYLPSVLRW